MYAGSTKLILVSGPRSLEAEAVYLGLEHALEFPLIGEATTAPDVLPTPDKLKTEFVHPTRLNQSGINIDMGKMNGGSTDVYLYPVVVHERLPGESVYAGFHMSTCDINNMCALNRGAHGLCVSFVTTSGRVGTWSGQANIRDLLHKQGDYWGNGNSCGYEAERPSPGNW